MANTYMSETRINRAKRAQRVIKKNAPRTPGPDDTHLVHVNAQELKLLRAASGHRGRKDPISGLLRFGTGGGNLGNAGMGGTGGTGGVGTKDAGATGGNKGDIGKDTGAKAPATTTSKNQQTTTGAKPGTTSTSTDAAGNTHTEPYGGPKEKNLMDKIGDAMNDIAPGGSPPVIRDPGSSQNGPGTPSADGRGMPGTSNPGAPKGVTPVVAAQGYRVLSAGRK